MGASMAAEQTNPVDVAEAVPPEKLGPWVAEHVPGASGTVEVTQIAGGSSNLTFRVRDGEHDWVLRRPPLRHVLATAHDMGREHRMQSALQATDVPVATQVAICEDESVIGAPFYMMARLDGVVYDDVDATASLTEEQGLAASFELDRRAGPPARGRLRGGRSRRLRSSRGLPRAPGQALADPVGEVEDGRDARGRRSRTRVSNGTCPPTAATRSCTATTASTTRCSGATTRRGCRPSSTGRCRRSAIRSPTSAWWRCTGPTWARSCGATASRRPTAPTPGSPTSTRCSRGTPSTSGTDLSQIDFYRAFATYKLAVIAQGGARRVEHTDPERAGTRHRHGATTRRPRARADEGY